MSPDAANSGNSVVIPASFLTTPNGWCEECSRLTPVDEMNEEHVCWRCTGQEVPFGVGLLPEEAEAVVTVEVSYTDSWDVSRGDFDGDDQEWRVLVAALKTPHSERNDDQRKLLREFERHQEDAFDRVGAQSEVFVDLLRPRKKAMAS